MLMKIFKHNGQYYLKKMQNGELTNQQVADILNVTVNTVNSEYNDYIEKQNPFKKKSFEYKNAIIQITISIISTFIVLFTLFEMQAARNATYLPDISLSNTEVAIAWDKNGLSYISEDDMNTISKITKEDTVINKLPQIKIYNIGVGTAKDISFEWNTSKNIKQFMHILNSCDDINISFDRSMVNIKTPSIEQGIFIPDNSQIDFLLNSTQEYDTLIFPLSYYQLIKEIYMRTDTREVPTLYLSVSFSDVQGKVYKKNIQINTNISFMTQNPDGSGFCVFTLTSAKENNSMGSVNLLNLDSDTLIAITSICAVIISIVSMIFTVIFSFLQLKHNKNSVKPISAIKFNDYENELAVKIENVGTGPLTIKKLIFKNNSQESSTLISLMPQIDQPWSTFTESVDGWTIPVGGQLILLRLCPESDETKTLVRKELSKITAYLEYTDIYNTKFKDKRSLNFFGRHYE